MLVAYDHHYKYQQMKKNLSFDKHILALLVCVILALSLLQYMFVRTTPSDGADDSLSEISSRIKGPLAYDDQYLIKIIQDRFLVPPPERPEITPLRIFPNDTSWEFIGKALKLLFKNKHGGFFIEVGALDGEYLSNSLYLENRLNWTGLLIEPDPETYHTLTTRKRNVWSCNACLSPTGYPKQLVLGSFRRNKIRPDDSNDLGNGYKAISQLLDDLDNTHFTTFFNVQCLPLASILLALGRTHVDLMILDVEGVEGKIIDTFPWEKIDIEVLVIEHKYALKIMKNGKNIEKHTVDVEFVQKFAKRGYTLMGHLNPPHDYVFVKNTSPTFDIADPLTLQDWAPFIVYR